MPFFVQRDLLEQFGKLRNQEFQLVTAEVLFRELEGVLSRPKFARRHGRSLAHQQSFTQGIRHSADVVVVDGSVQVCRDPKDDVLIEAAIRGGAPWLVSADEDLHAIEVSEYLAPFGIRVLTVPEFLAVLRENRLAADTTNEESPDDA